MGVIFSSNFNNPGYSEWAANKNPRKRLVGCDGSLALACCPYTYITIEGNVEYVTPSPLGAGTLRWQMAYWNPADILSTGIFEIQAAITESPWYWRQLSIGLNGDGGGRLAGSYFGTPIGHFDFSPGTFPVDGTWHGYEFTFVFSLVPSTFGLDVWATFELRKDNVQIGTGSIFLNEHDHGPSAHVPPTWVRVNWIAESNATGPNIFILALDNIEIEDSATIRGNPPCNGVPLFGNLSANSCSGLYAAPSITSLAVDCPNSQILVNGNGFLQGAVITVTNGPGGPAIPFGLVSSTLTQIRLQISPPFTDGNYCVQVTNQSSTGPSNEFCATLTCPLVVPVVTGVSVNCALAQVTIVGTDFAPDATIGLTINGIPNLVFSIISRNATQIVLGNLAPFLTGNYCATVTNTGVPSSTLCAALNCPLPEISGIYYIDKNKPQLHDSYYNGTELKIPNPTIKTALIGE